LKPVHRNKSASYRATKAELEDLLDVSVSIACGAVPENLSLEAADHPSVCPKASAGRDLPVFRTCSRK
jgi:hypothetical protein